MAVLREVSVAEDIGDKERTLRAAFSFRTPNGNQHDLATIEQSAAGPVEPSPLKASINAKPNIEGIVAAIENVDLVSSQLANNRACTTATDDGDNQPISSDNADMALPRSTMPLESQIAGHRHGHGKTKMGMLRHEDGAILKPLMPRDVRAKREHEFYLSLECHLDNCRLESPCDDPVLHELAQLTPRYLGLFETELILGSDEPRKTLKVNYMKLEDLCQQFKRPCVADLKIGRVTHDPEASAEKIEQSVSKYPAQWDIGYRILGMRVFEQGRCHVYDATYGLQQTSSTVIEAIKTFTAANVRCVPLILAELERILDWFLIQKRFAFYSSSILFVYDADDARCSVKLIDFAHVFPSEGPDENYLFGLRNLVEAFRVVASTEPKSPKLSSTKIAPC